MKLIRECRMGEPKTFKTGAVVGSYPKPMLYLQFDREGIDVIPPKDKVLDPGLIAPDVRYEEIVKIKPGEVPEYLDGRKPFPKVLCINYAGAKTADLSRELLPAKNSESFDKFISDYNYFAAFINLGKELPFKTVVMDSVTGYEDMILSHISMFNPGAMQDARQWAGQVGGKVRQTILTFTTWPCHVVVLLHAALEKNELTGETKMKPNVFSQGLRDDMGSLFSQFFFSTKNMLGKPVVWTSSQMFVTGIGTRWPLGLPQECAPDFKTIYGAEGLV